MIRKTKLKFPCSEGGILQLNAGRPDYRLRRIRRVPKVRLKSRDEEGIRVNADGLEGSQLLSGGVQCTEGKIEAAIGCGFDCIEGDDFGVIDGAAACEGVGEGCPAMGEGVFGWAGVTGIPAPKNRDGVGGRSTILKT